jgi:uncharacterized protein YpmS
MNPIISYVIQNWKFVLYVLLAILIVLFLVIRKINFAIEGTDGKINEVQFNNSSDYDELCVQITGRRCSEQSK